MTGKGDERSRPDRLLTVREVAEWLHVSERTVHRLIAGGELRSPVKIGRSTRFHPGDVASLVERSRRALS